MIEDASNGFRIIPIVMLLRPTSAVAPKHVKYFCTNCAGDRDFRGSPSVEAVHEFPPSLDPIAFFTKNSAIEAVETCFLGRLHNEAIEVVRLPECPLLQFVFAPQFLSIILLFTPSSPFLFDVKEDLIHVIHESPTASFPIHWLPPVRHDPYVVGPAFIPIVLAFLAKIVCVYGTGALD